MMENAELIIVQKLIGNLIGELLAKEYGTAKIELNCQAGQIVSGKFSVEQSVVGINRMDPTKVV